MEKGEVQLLINKVKSGDKESYKKIFDLYYHDLFQIAYRLIKDRICAQEVVQDFFVKFWLKRQDINISYSFRSYSYRSVYNSSLNVIRDSKRFTSINEVNQDYIEDEPKFECSEDDLRVKAAIDSLPPQCRKVFTFICIDGFSYAETASELGISINTVKVQMSKAYRLLRATLSIQVLLYFIVKMV